MMLAKKMHCPFEEDKDILLNWIKMSLLTKETSSYEN
jgi:hypothetical protein